MRFAEKNNLPMLNNVTLPRMGAFFVVRDTLLKSKDHQGIEPAQLKEINGALNNNNNNNDDDDTNSIHCPKKEKQGVPGEVPTAAKLSGTEQNEENAELEYVLDITMAYPDGKPLNLQSILTGLREPCQTVLYYRVYSSREVNITVKLKTVLSKSELDNLLTPAVSIPCLSCHVMMPH